MQNYKRERSPIMFHDQEQFLKLRLTGLSLPALLCPAHSDQFPSRHVSKQAALDVASVVKSPKVARNRRQQAQLICYRSRPLAPEPELTSQPAMSMQHHTKHKMADA